MEKVMNPPRLCESKASDSCLAVRKESHLVSKQAPKVRIIHIYAPEIIKTDVANFRELVQRLTGKPVGKRSGKSKGRKIRCKPSEAREISRCNSAESSDLGSGCKSSDCGERVKEEEEEEEIWGGENFSFFGGLGDLDGFIQGLTDQFPLAPLSSSQMDVFGGGHFS